MRPTHVLITTVGASMEQIDRVNMAATKWLVNGGVLVLNGREVRPEVTFLPDECTRVTVHSGEQIVIEERDKSRRKRIAFVSKEAFNRLNMNIGWECPCDNGDFPKGAIVTNVSLHAQFDKDLVGLMFYHEFFSEVPPGSMVPEGVHHFELSIPDQKQLESGESPSIVVGESVQ